MLEAYTLSQSYDRLLEEYKALQEQLTEKDATIKSLEFGTTQGVQILMSERDSLRKALEEARDCLNNNDMNESYYKGFIGALKFFGYPFEDSASGEGEKQ